MTNKLYHCGYHVKGVECSSYEVQASSIELALAVCNMRLLADYPNQECEILSIWIIESDEE